MIIEIVEVPRRRFKSLTKKIVKAICDHCQVAYEFPLASHQSKAKNNFCSYDCVHASRLGGVFQAHLKEVMINKYGVENPSQVPEISEKRKQTFIERLGVDNPLKLDRVRRGTPEQAQKAFQTLKSRGLLKTSAPENAFHQFLCEVFEEHTIDRWVRINRWNIDFYVKSIDTYIQFDGIFWHGLDRPIEEIRESFRPIDKQICLKWETDQRQNEWFEQNNLRLVRVTDQEFDSLEGDVLKERILSK